MVVSRTDIFVTMDIIIIDRKYEWNLGFRSVLGTLLSWLWDQHWDCHRMVLLSLGDKQGIVKKLVNNLLLNIYYVYFLVTLCLATTESEEKRKMWRNEVPSLSRGKRY